MLKLCLRFFILIIVSTASHASGMVKICGDGAEWPPYMYYNRVDGVADKSHIIGATTDLLSRIFEIADLEHSIDLVPWKRCLHFVFNFNGSPEGYEIFADASANPERDEKSLRSLPIYQTSAGFIYSSLNSKISDSINDLNSTSDLNEFAVCGIAGYNYSPWMDAGLISKIDTGSKDLKTVLQKIKLKRCDVLLSFLEPVYGAASTQSVYLDALKTKVLPDLEKSKFYIYISKKSPRADSLLKEINSAIKMLQDSGEAEKIYKKYNPTGTGFN